jgi:hypothetical protein
MCMYVTEVPRTNAEGLLVRCVKMLVPRAAYSPSPYFTTPYQEVECEGLLLPRGRSRRQHYGFGEAIHGSHIHAFTFGSQPKELTWTGTPRRFDAYAFRVLAYGPPAHPDAYESDESHLVCRAIYVPDTDPDTARRRKVMRIIKNILRQEKIRIPMFKPLFPLLPQIKGFY